MSAERPYVILLAGPNGAGKTTLSDAILSQGLKIDEFLNADQIAKGLCAFAPERVAVEAGEILLRRLHKLAERKRSFAFETTLASRSLAPWIRSLKQDGYFFALWYVWLQSADLAVQRVMQRVATGGHQIPEETIRRRYQRSVQNLKELYLPLADRWEVLDNSESKLRLIASLGADGKQVIHDSAGWEVVFG